MMMVVVMTDMMNMNMNNLNNSNLCDFRVSHAHPYPEPGWGAVHRLLFPVCGSFPLHLSGSLAISPTNYVLLSK